MQFEFFTTTRIIFGSGKVKSIGHLAKDFGHRVLIISGVPEVISERLSRVLEESDITSAIFKIGQEPTIDIINYINGYAHNLEIDLIIGIGGGSALDAAKATSILFTNPGEITDYLEVIGLNKPLLNPPLPVIAIPSTAGTGSEVTRNAVLGSPVHHIKVSLRSPLLFPRIALVDPEVTLSLPPDVTAATGMDALTQLIEPYTCNNPNPLVDSLCLEGIHLISYSLKKVFDNGYDLQAREQMSFASLLSGLTLANAKLGAVHGLAGPLGGEIPVPHGTICACLLPFVMKANIAALLKSYTNHPIIERYSKIGQILTNNPSATAEMGVDWIRNFKRYAGIQPLSTYGLTEKVFDHIIDKALDSSSMKGNPVILSTDELRNILKRSL